ncbi:MAG: LytTr DNA-binding domain protein [Hyphobacterium sp.]|nr:MAG: LytTr DNA-binding domain protein [Hyphobacterium sp.]
MQKLSNWLKAHGTGYLFVAGLGTFLAILGPYNTSGLGWPWVWLYWVGLMILGGASGNIAVALLDRFGPNLPSWVTYPIVALLVSLPVTAAVLGIQAAIGTPQPLAYWPVVFLLVFVIAAGVTALNYVMERRNPAASEVSAGRALTDKLPVRLRTADILALQSEDHYLRVHTQRGDALILMRLGDAMAALEKLEGAQTHRSWWVARTAIEHAEKAGGRAVLTLTNKIEAPVSRNYYPKLRDQGWI